MDSRRWEQLAANQFNLFGIAATGIAHVSGRWPLRAPNVKRIRAPHAYKTDECICGRRRGFERLIRKMLNLPNRPAVMYFHVWTPRRLGFKFYDSPENLIEMVPEYYGLPSISMRNALYHVVANFTVPADWLWRSDINHANCLGHRCAGFSPVDILIQGCPPFD